jgi:ABC-type antimicrobial peptide transport system permease subunit
VVGVSRDIHAVTDPEDGDIPGMWFLSYAQNPGFLADDVTIVVHSALPVETLQKQIRAELNQVDSSIAPHEFNTVSRLIEDSRAQDRFGVLLVGLFGALGLVLSAVGLYGLLSFQVAHRTREFGVRTAMGARAGDTIRLILKEGGALLLLGLALGFAIAMALARIIESQLYEVRTGDPAFYIAASLVLTIAAALACGLPARRAARVEPMVALRDN